MARKSKINAKKLIGKSVGCEIDFKIYKNDKSVKVFTTRPDTIFGATFFISVDHPLCKDYVKRKDFYRF